MTTTDPRARGGCAPVHPNEHRVAAPTETGDRYDRARDRWNSPEPLPAPGRPLPDFPLHALPTWVGEHAGALAEQTQTPPDLAGCLSLAALSTAASGRVRIDTGMWSEPCCLYTVVAMEPASRKSAVFTAMTAPLAEAEHRLAEQAAPRIREAELTRRVALAQAKKAAKTAETEGTPQALAQAVRAAEQAAHATVPAPPRLIVADITPANLARQLAEQGGGLSLLSPEGGFFSTLGGRHGGTPNLETFLKAHAGDPIRVDRQGRAPDRVPAPALTIGVALQPEAVRDILATPGGRGRGMTARILFSLPRSTVGFRQIGRSTPMPAQVRHTYHQHLNRLLTWARHHPRPVTLTLAEQARERIVHLHDEVIEPQLRPNGRLGHIGDWGGKLLGATVRIAGLLHTARHLENADQHPVQAATLHAAEEIGRYYSEHALAVFDRTDPASAHAIAGRVLTHLRTRTSTDGTIGHRDLFTALRCSTLQRSGDLDPAVALLTDLGWLRPAPGPATPAPGRPSRRYLVNPRLYRP
ncbi:YfjI family protein [Nocardiopsis sp. CNT312]|uniref:YfjI family protein n=1 Tax=Nocardiopsis sp. CNT312 TaxID=1137268 RepID=UPI0004BC2161|nr:YfjI family protein [Nocardiopsis sp. CNT312]